MVQAIHSTSTSLELVKLLSDLCDAVPQPLGGLTGAEREERKRFLEILEWRIRNVDTSTALPHDEQSHLKMELCKLAMLVYLHRTTAGQLQQTTSIQAHIDRAFGILARLDLCERQLPIFVFGCEARSDAQRGTILDLWSRTENSVCSRLTNHSRLLLQAIWAQNDLAEGTTTYWNKISYVMSCCTIGSSFI